MDTMFITKIVGGACGALLVYLMINWGAETMYHTGGDHGESASAGYVIEVEETGSTEAASDGPSFEDMMLTAEAEKGKKVFSKCKACHKVEDGANSTGPHLFGILDREIGKVAGFGYSGGMSSIGGTWNVETLNTFLTKPKDFISDTKMSFAGLKKDKDRANLITYLMTVK